MRRLCVVETIDCVQPSVQEPWQQDRSAGNGPTTSGNQPPGATFICHHYSPSLAELALIAWQGGLRPPPPLLFAACTALAKVPGAQ